MKHSGAYDECVHRVSKSFGEKPSQNVTSIFMIDTTNCCLCCSDRLKGISSKTEGTRTDRHVYQNTNEYHKLPWTIPHYHLDTAPAERLHSRGKNSSSVVVIVVLSIY